jgi:flavorubredoxin
MKTTQVTDGVFRLSANVENILFEGMWPIPNGIALNSYVVKGEKAAIIDGVCTWEGVPETLFQQLGQAQIDYFEREAARYYADIVAAFSQPTLKAVKEVEALDPEIVAPGHGIVWRDKPQKIIDDYRRYANYSRGPAKPEVTVLWGSMYGNTEAGVQPVVEGIESENLRVRRHKVPDTHIGFVLQSVWESSGVVIGVPTYEYKLFPPMAYALDEIGRKRAQNRKAFSFGSYGWSGGAQKELREIVERNRMKWDFLDPVEFAGRPSEEDKERLRERGRELARRVKEWCRQSERQTTSP